MLLRLIECSFLEKKRICYYERVKTRLWIICLLLGSFYLGVLYIPKSKFRKKQREKLSHISQVAPYLCFCNQALNDASVFATFKRHPIYTLFYENTTYEEGLYFYENLKREFPQFLDSDVLYRVHALDTVGSPKVFYYGEIGFWSPSTLRSLYIAAVLQKRFGSLDGMNIVEMGAGNGGLCKILHELFNIESYTVIDIAQTLELTKKYLGHLGVNRVRFFTFEQFSSLDSDLLISQFAFTESNRKLQEKYLDSLFKQAKRGYLICHFPTKHFQFHPFSKEALLKRIASLHLGLKCQRVQEDVVLVWDQNAL